jgi:hypothetical protein
MRRHYWSGIILIFVGLLLLLDEMNTIQLEWYDILFFACIVIGLIKFRNGWGRSDKRGILGGTFFITFGLLMELISNHYLVSDDDFVFAIFFLSLSLANLVYFILRNFRWGNLTWAVIFGATGGLFLISYYGYYPRWYLYDILSTYWPVAIILLGVTLLVRGLKKQHHALT